MSNHSLPHCGLFVTLIDACNINCNFCPFPKRKKFRNGNKLDYSAFVKMLNELSSNPPPIPLNSVCFCGSSEPLLYNKVTELIAETKRIVPFVSLVTNGVLLSKEMSKNLLNARVDHIVISITGDTAEVYNKYQGSGKTSEKADEQFKLVRNNVENFVKLRDELKSPTQIGISYILHEKSKCDLFKSLNHYYKIGVNYVDVRIESLGFRKNSDFLDEYDEYIKEVQHNFNGIVCTCFGKVMDVSTDGTLRFCNCSYVPETILGNIFKTPLAEILNSEKFAKLDKAFYGGGGYQNIPELCKKCDLMRARPILA